ncbi:RNA polymerase sigma factor [Methylobacter sp.]
MHWNGVDLNWAYNVLLVSILGRTQCMHRAQDVLHDSLLRFALVNKLKPVKQPHAYLRTVVRSVLADQHRDQSRWTALPENDEEQHGNPVADFGGFAPSAEHLAELNQRLEILQRVLDCLPPRCREVFWLFRVEGFSQKEIAEQLGVGLKAVEYQLARALVDLEAVSTLLA